MKDSQSSENIESIENTQSNQLVEDIKKSLDLMKYSADQGNLFLKNIKELSDLTNNNLKSAIKDTFPFIWRGKSAFYYKYQIGDNYISIRFSQTDGSGIYFNYNNDKYSNNPLTIQETNECIHYYREVSYLLNNFNKKLSQIGQKIKSENLIYNL